MLEQLVKRVARDLCAVAASVAHGADVEARLGVVGEDVVADADVLEVAAEAGRAVVGALAQDGQNVFLE